MNLRKRHNVCAIVVSYKNEDMTINFVNEELSKIREVDDIIIVNNASTPESNDKIRRGIPDSKISDCGEMVNSKVVILGNEKNQGYARGNNQGARYVKEHLKSKYILITNDDIIIDNSTIIQKLISKIEENDKIGCIGPKIIKLDGRIQMPFDYQTLFKRYFVYTLYPILTKFAPKLLSRFLEKRGQHLESGFYYGVVGCFFLIKSDLFYQVEMMDESTFLYREEEILAERLKKIGKKNYCLADVSIHHLIGRSSEKIRKKNNMINEYTRESDLYYYHQYKNYPKFIIKAVQNMQDCIYRLLCR